MHKIFITEGIALSKRAAGESNSSISVLTRDMGLLRASAQSARVSKSKLRYGLEPMTRGTFSFVEGKRGWRLVGIIDAKREFSAHASARAAAGRISKLLTRLIHGEEVSSALFEAVTDGFSLFARASQKEEIESVECVLVLRILHLLGYLPKSAELAPFINDGALSLEMASEAAERRSSLIKAINESLQATGL